MKSVYLWKICVHDCPEAFIKDMQFSRGRGRPKKQAAQASPPQNVDATEQSEDPDKPSSIAEDSATLGRRTPDADTKQVGILTLPNYLCHSGDAHQCRIATVGSVHRV